MQTYTFLESSYTQLSTCVMFSKIYDKNNTFSCHGNMTNDNSHKIAKLKIYLLQNLIAIFDEKTGFFGLLRE